MGLDGVEIVLEVEEHFGITITDAEAADVRTVGDLLAIIESRYANCESKTCVSMPAFLKVRRLVRDFLEYPELRLRPSTSISAAIPFSRRQALWQRFSEFYGAQVPELRRPLLLRYLLCGITACVYLAGASTFFVDSAMLPAGIAAATLVCFLLYVLTLPLKLVPPVEFSTFGDVARRSIGLQQATKTVGQTEFLPDLQKIVSTNLGVDRDEVVPNARFVEDLDMN